jgi:radical SAM protein with 4Fe4S-binding SPASM domain
VKGFSQPGENVSTDSLLEDFFRDRPRSAMIEIADRCNERCVHCYQIQGQKGEMETEEIFGVLDQIAASGVLFLTISGGEATLRSDFLEIVRYARSLDFAIKLYSNGLRIDRDLAEQLARIGIRCAEISLYSVDPAIHDWTTQVPGSWQKTTRGIRYLTEAGVPVLMKTPLMSTNAEEFQAYDELARKLGATQLMSPDLKAREDGDRAPERLQTSDEESLEVLRQGGYFDGRTGSPLSAHTRPPCGACRQLHVEANGEVQPCTLLDVPLGNLRNESIDEVMASPDAQFLRQVRWADLDGCDRCAIADHCSRCHAQSLREVGHALRPYPSACRRALLVWGEVHDTDTSALRERQQLGPFELQPDGSVVPSQSEAPTVPSAGLPAWVSGSARAAEPLVTVGQLVRISRPGSKPKAESVPKRFGHEDETRTR